MPIKVRELIEILKEMPQEQDVVLQRDAEGNGYEFLRCFEDNLMFDEDNAEVTNKEDYDENKYEDDPEFQPNCVVLSP